MAPIGCRDDGWCARGDSNARPSDPIRWFPELALPLGSRTPALRWGEKLSFQALSRSKFC